MEEKKKRRNKFAIQINIAIKKPTKMAEMPYNPIKWFSFSPFVGFPPTQHLLPPLKVIKFTPFVFNGLILFISSTSFFIALFFGDDSE